MFGTFYLKWSWVVESQRSWCFMSMQEHWRLNLNPVHSPFRACAHSSVQPVNLHSCNACGGLRMPDRLAPSPGPWLPTPAWVSIIILDMKTWKHSRAFCVALFTIFCLIKFPLWPETCTTKRAHHVPDVFVLHSFTKPKKKAIQLSGNTKLVFNSVNELRFS